MIKKTIMLGVVFLVLATPVSVITIQNKINSFNLFPFKCLTFTRYILNDNNKDIYFNVSQDLRFYSLQDGYFLIGGTTQSGDKISKINRSVRFEAGSLTQGKTFSYKIKSIEKLNGDDITDDLFQLLLNEYTIGKDDFQVDVFKIDNLSYLIGGPHSFINTCTRY
ncbi:FidL-like putative membrane protein [Enterobacter sp. BIGb0383]|uniref:hypothetical protein n=1 Tax=unclassified Enterobacter TaxID=2608935 RepID=UPI000FB2E94A|nr:MULTISPECIES: hypothetical protein [unclassified Enterobacter]ROP59348.1 FidL-like putative membrane protein [Enterobacter sp. BIGb0383]ROS09186.1 FidL-like putative membrane protein [Enterobacter sp. BIGb0359]